MGTTRRVMSLACGTLLGLMLPAFSMAAEPVPPTVHSLLVAAKHIEVPIAETARNPPFRQGPCAIVRGLLATTDANPADRLTNFSLQRQEVRQQPAADGDTEGNWVSVDFRQALSVLQTVRGFAEDSTPPGKTHPVITMPLPERSDGTWGSEASHPGLKKRKEGQTLFRFVDFQAKPGFWYRYRVQLAYSNAGRPGGVKSAWSSPSAWTQIPRRAE